MTLDPQPPKITEEDLAALDAALEADEKRGPEAFLWVDELPEAPPLDSDHTTAFFLRSDDDISRGDRSRNGEQ